MGFLRVSLVCLSLVFVFSLTGCGKRKEGWTDERYQQAVNSCVAQRTMRGASAEISKDSCTCYYDKVAEKYDWQTVASRRSDAKVLYQLNLDCQK